VADLAGLNKNEKSGVTQLLANAIPGGEKMLSELLGKSVSIVVKNVDLMDASEVNSIMPGKNLVAPSVLSDGTGSVVMVVAEAQAALMADLMIGQDGENPPAVLEDLHLSAVSELTGQVVGAIVSGISSQVSKAMLSNPGEVVVKKKIDIKGSVIVVEAQIIIGEFSPGKTAFVFEGKIVNLMKSGPKEAASVDGFVGDMTGGTVKSGGPAAAQKITTSELHHEARTYNGKGENLELLLDVPLQVTVELGRTDKLVREVLELSPGSVIELDKLAGEPVDVLVNQKYIAKGEVVVIDENFGIRITDIVRPADRIPKG